MKKIIKDRQDYIAKYCKGKNVLHLGCIGSSYNRHSKYEPWLHKIICDVSKSCIGLDNNKERIPLAEKLSKSKIYYGNVLNFDLKRKFDVIVAGEIIEHIDNFKSFFDSIKKHMKKNSILIITTPNAFNLSNIFRVLVKGQVRPNWNHVVFFDLFTLINLLKMNGFKTVKHYYNTEICPQRIRNIIVRIIGSIIPIYHLNLMVVIKKK